MLDWTAVRPTSKLPPCEAPRLTPEVLPREWLKGSDQQEMYGLLAAYFQNTTFRQFAEDLAEKDIVILLRDPREGRVAGFSTLVKLPVTVANRRVVGFFSGDTIIAREHWGSSLLGRLWLRTVFREADRIGSQAPGTLFYWFLICSGYKTWRYLPIFFRNYSPHPESSASAFDRQVLHELATRKFADEYHADAGVIRFHHANPLRPGVADVTGQRLRDPMVEFFLRMNPGHDRGDELACLAPISRANLTPAGLRLMAAGAPR
ncbi:MAG TPA: hypothetical protein VGH38_17210 [Bryobacteraceae bacterium]